MTINEKRKQIIEKTNEKVELSTDLSEDRIVKIELDDQTILATDQNQKDLLKLSIQSENQTITFQFPKYGKWDLFCRDLSLLFQRLSIAASNLQLPESFVNIQNESSKLPLDMRLLAISIQPKQVSKLIEKIFFKYLNPKIGDKKYYGMFTYYHIWKARRILAVDTMFRMFVAILAVEEWVKKNGTYVLARMFGLNLNQELTLSSTKNTETLKKKSEIVQ